MLPQIRSVKEAKINEFFVKRWLSLAKPLALYHSGYCDCDCHALSGPEKQKTG
jgi:hypothetical protein